MNKQSIRTKAQKTIIELLKSRKENGSLVSEVDILVGASAILNLVNKECFNASDEKSMELVPPSFILAPMAGRSLLEEK